MERWNGTIKSECIRPGVPLCLDDAIRLIEQYVAVYNEQRLHSSIGYVTPKDMLEGHRQAIHDARDHKLETARQRREQASRNRLTQDAA
ncbi:MAG: integrase core domain-containing protein [Bryobacter sp.]|nr:integrase core domain-containing protein [Bryobacter sp. CoA8 C33]